jgi:hypothetical protein
LGGGWAGGRCQGVIAKVYSKLRHTTGPHISFVVCCHRDGGDGVAQQLEPLLGAAGAGGGAAAVAVYGAGSRCLDTTLGMSGLNGECPAPSVQFSRRCSLQCSVAVHHRCQPPAYMASQQQTMTSFLHMPCMLFVQCTHCARCRQVHVGTVRCTACAQRRTVVSVPVPQWTLGQHRRLQ